MNCVLFAKMDKVFSKKNKTLKNYWKMEKNTGKVMEKSGNFVNPDKWEPCPGGICSRGGCAWPRGGLLPGGVYLVRPCGQTDACKNITFGTSLRMVKTG